MDLETETSIYCRNPNKPNGAVINPYTECDFKTYNFKKDVYYYFEFTRKEVDPHHLIAEIILSNGTTHTLKLTPEQYGTGGLIFAPPANVTGRIVMYRIMPGNTSVKYKQYVLGNYPGTYLDDVGYFYQIVPDEVPKLIWKTVPRYTSIVLPPLEIGVNHKTFLGWKLGSNMYQPGQSVQLSERHNQFSAQFTPYP